jgi:protein-disulfide isomerase
LIRTFALRVGLLIALVVSTAAVAWTQSSDPGSQVVAVVGNRKITLRQLSQQAGPALLDARYHYYQAQRSALDQVIDHTLLQEEAKREGISVDQLLKLNVTDKVKDPSPEALELLYENLSPSVGSYDSIRGKLLEHVRQQRQQRLYKAYLKTLSDKAHIQITLQPPVEQVALDNAPVRGPQDAPVTIIEFGDFQCPYCRQEEPALKKLQSNFHGKIKLAFKDFPLPMHQYAEKAAEAGRCAAVQGKFWQFHDAAYATSDDLTVSRLKQIAKSLDLDTASFDKCLDSGEEAATIQKEIAQGRALGLSGTPSFFINDHFISGALPYNELSSVVEQELSLSRTASNS